MREDGDVIGGDNRSLRYSALFCFGVVIGSVVRFAEWVVPAQLERVVKRALP